MDLKLLNEPLPKDVCIELGVRIVKEGSDIEDLMQIFFKEKNMTAQRAAWAIEVVVEQKPQLVSPYMHEMIDALEGDTTQAFRRNALKFLRKVELGDDDLGKLTNICFGIVQNAKEAIAIKMYSIYFLQKVTFMFPDLAQELFYILQNNYDQ
ncbi:MAG: hypothetical protein C0594_00060, partial [Marinilabiliales bacterium]